MTTAARRECSLPADIAAERDVIGAVLKTQDGMDRVLPVLASSEAFYDPKHQLIYETMLGLYRDRVAVDITSVRERLLASEKIMDAGGASYMVEAIEDAYAPWNLEDHAQIVRGKWMLRELIAQADEIRRDCYKQEDAPADIMSKAEERIFQLRSNSQAGWIHSSQVAASSLAEIDEHMTGKIAASRVQTGFRGLDNIVHGLGPGELIVVGGWTSQGKTQLAVQIARHVAVEQNKPIGFVSLEMKAGRLGSRLISAQSHISAEKWKQRKLTDSDSDRITQAANRLVAAPIYILDKPGLDPMEVRAQARRLKAQHDLRLLVVDYLQIMESVKRFENRQVEVATFSRYMKYLAGELDIPVLVLSQLRDPEGEKVVQPSLRMVRESRAIAQDADIVVMVFYTKDKCKLIVEKNRDGRRGDVQMTFIDGRWEEIIQKGEHDG